MACGDYQLVVQKQNSHREVFVTTEKIQRTITPKKALDRITVYETATSIDHPCQV